MKANIGLRRRVFEEEILLTLALRQKSRSSDIGIPIPIYPIIVGFRQLRFLYGYNVEYHILNGLLQVKQVAEAQGTSVEATDMTGAEISLAVII
jgi:hypothetical protein